MIQLGKPHNTLLPNVGRSSIELTRNAFRNLHYTCSGGCGKSIVYEEWMIQINGEKFPGGSGDLHFHIECFFRSTIEALRITGVLKFKSIRQMMEEIEQEILIEAILENGVKVR